MVVLSKHEIVPRNNTRYLKQSDDTGVECKVDNSSIDGFVFKKLVNSSQGFPHL